VLHRTVRHHQAMRNIKICSFFGRVVDNLLYKISVVRMNALEHQLQRRLHRSIVLKDVVGFLRPVDFSAENAPAEAARMAEGLSLGQESFAALQSRSRFVLLGDIYGGSEELYKIP